MRGIIGRAILSFYKQKLARNGATNTLPTLSTVYASEYLDRNNKGAMLFTLEKAFVGVSCLQ